MISQNTIIGKVTIAVSVIDGMAGGAISNDILISKNLSEKSMIGMCPGLDAPGWNGLYIVSIRVRILYLLNVISLIIIVTTYPML